jgi:hypothetical protein
MNESGATFEESLLRSATLFGNLCDEFDLVVSCRQPFKTYERLPSRTRHEEKIAKLKV